MKFLHLAALICLSQSIHISSSNSNSMHHGDSDEDETPRSSEEESKNKVKVKDPVEDLPKPDKNLYDFGEDPVDELNRALEHRAT